MFPCFTTTTKMYTMYSDVCSMKCYIIILLRQILFGNITGFSQKSDGVCYTRDIVGYDMEICCLYFELIDRICKECELEYYRIPTAKKCEPCPSNLYGEKCASVCKCKANQRCDSKNGTCIRWTSTIGTFSTQSTIIQYQHQTTGANKRIFGENHTRYIAGGAILILICICASYALVKQRSRTSAAVIIIPSVNALHNHVSNQAGTTVALDLLNHDYEEIDETVFNDFPQFRNNQFEESDSDSTKSCYSNPSEDAEGYLNPYHSFVHHQRQCGSSTLNTAGNAGSPYYDQNQYDCLNLSNQSGYHNTKEMSQGTIMKTTENYNKGTAVYRISI